MNILSLHRRLAVQQSQAICYRASSMQNWHRNEPRRFVIWNLPGFALLTTSLQNHLMGESIA